MITELLSQELAFQADGIHAASKTVGDYLTGAVNLGIVRQVLFVVDSGTLGGSGTVDFAVYGSATSGGSYTLIANTAITQIATSGKYALVCVTAEAVTALQLGYHFIKGQIAVGTATSVVAVSVFGSDTRFEPASLQNVAAVVQIVTLFD